MTTNFLDSFSGSSVSPSQVAFASYTFSTNLTLFWPDFSAGQTNIAARFMNMTATAGSLNTSMPDATLVSTGYDVIIFNKGSNTFNVVDFNGGAIATIAAGQTYYILLNDNTTQAGGWQTVQFGVGTGSASAAALAGEGLVAAAGLLETNIATDVQTIDYMITALSRARLQVWEGGAGVITLPTTASVGNGFFFPIANNGTGSVTVTPSGGDQIDGASTSVFTQTQSAYIVSSGTDWHTIGKGLQNNFSVTLLNLNVAGSSDVTETSAQAQNIIQQFTGALTGNINVIVPNTVQLYYIFNNTTGTHTLTVKTAAGTGFVIPQATHVILYCDGTNVVSGFSSTLQIVGTPTYSIGVAGGTANALTGNATNFVLQLGTVVWLTAGLLNTGPATLNVQGTGAIAIKKVAPTGLVDMSPNDLIPGLVNVVYYNGTYWISVNTIYEGLYQTLSGSTTMDFSYFLNSVNVTTAVNLTLPVTTAFPSYFYTTLFAKGGAITLIPNAADSIQGGTAGVNYVMPQGSSAKLATDGAGNWTLFLLTGVSGAIVNDNTTNATVYPIWVTASSGNLPLKVSSTQLSFNPSTGVLTALGGFGGNASTATALQTARTIGGVSFNGTANITVASATSGFAISGGGLVLSGATSGTTTVNSGAIAGSSVLTLPVATDTLVGKATTDTLTNKTFDTAGTGNSFSINGLAATANTGTGSVVRGTSPTIATPTLSGATTAGIINATGLTTITNNASGNTSSGLNLINNTLANFTGTAIILQPSTTVGQGWQIRAQNDGSDNISLNFLSLIAGSGTFRVQLPFTGGIIVNSATGSTGVGDVNITGNYLVNGTALNTVTPATVTQFASAATLVLTVDFTTYASYKLHIFNAGCSSGAVAVSLDVSQDAGSTYKTTTIYGTRIAGTTVTNQTDGIGATNGSGSTSTFTSTIDIFQRATGSATDYTFNSADITAGGSGSQTGGASCATTAAVNRIKLTVASGSWLTSGYVIFYPTSKR